MPNDYRYTVRCRHKTPKECTFYAKDVLYENCYGVLWDHYIEEHAPDDFDPSVINLLSAPCTYELYAERHSGSSAVLVAGRRTHRS